MGLIINLPKRYIEVESTGVKLLFSKDSDFFYLRVIATVAQKMKDRADVWDDKQYISINEIEDEIKLFTNGFESVESMRICIYQTWRDYLKPMEQNSRYEIQWPQNEHARGQGRPNINKYFELEPGRGPRKGPAFRINENPTQITIIPDTAFSNIIKTSIKQTATTTLSDAEKAEQLIEKLEQVIAPKTYANVMVESNKAIASLLDQQETCKPKDSGTLPLSAEEYAEIYLKYLGITGASAASLMDIWFRELASEPWWTELIYTFNAEQQNTNSSYFEPDPKEMVERCLKFGDIISLVWLFHWAYLSTSIAAKRKYFVSELQHQNECVKKHVFQRIGKMARTEVDAYVVAKNIHLFIKHIQRRRWFGMLFLKSI